MSKDYYKILGISNNASKEEIKRAYRALAHKYHPDKAGGDEKRFKEINEAYQVLSNDQKKAQYDQFGDIFSGQAGRGASGGWDFSGQSGPAFSWEDLFRGFGSSGQGPFQYETRGSGEGWDFGDIFGDVFSRGQTKKQRRKAQDILVDLEIGLEDIYKGAKKEIKLQKLVVCSKCKGSGGEPGSPMKKCSTCKGRGQIQQTQRTILGSFSKITTCPECQGDGEIPEKTCAKCRGKGVIRDVEKININIPAGIDDNQIIKLEGQGQAGGRGKLSGDLYIRIHIKEHKDLTKKGDDIYYNANISFTQAALGDKIEIPTLEKKIKLKIPAGIQFGKLLRIKGGGLPRLGGGRGDQLVRIQVETPKKLSQKAKNLFKQLRDEGI